MSLSLLERSASVAIPNSSRDLDPSVYDEIVVIPDVHGDLNAFVKSIYLAFVSVTNVNWSLTEFFLQFGPRMNGAHTYAPMCTRARTLLVQLGDIADRGPDTKSVMRAMYMLDVALGWDVVSLVGNHELYGRFGTTSYVHKDDIEAFGGARSRQVSYNSGGEMWDIIRERYSLVARVGETLFVHAGIDPAWFSKSLPVYGEDGTVSVNKLNSWGRKALENDAHIKNLLLDSRSPLMTRALSQLDDASLCGNLWPRVKRLFKIEQIVVGHSAGPNVRFRCDNEIILADFAMSGWKHTDGNGQAGFVQLSLKNGRTSTITSQVRPAASLTYTQSVSIKVSLPERRRVSQTTIAPPSASTTIAANRNVLPLTTVKTGTTAAIPTVVATTLGPGSDGKQEAAPIDSDEIEISELDTESYAGSSSSCGSTSTSSRSSSGSKRRKVTRKAHRSSHHRHTLRANGRSDNHRLERLKIGLPIVDYSDPTGRPQERSDASLPDQSVKHAQTSRRTSPKSPKTGCAGCFPGLRSLFRRSPV